MSEPINPNKLQALCKPWNDGEFLSEKCYIPVFTGNGKIYRARKVFERRSEAREYAEKLLVVWKRVYPLFVAWNAQSEPTP